MAARTGYSTGSAAGGAYLWEEFGQAFLCAAVAVEKVGRPALRLAYFSFAMPTSATGRILALDYGHKRVGLAVTDPLQLIASPLDTIHSQDVLRFVLDYHQREPLAAVVVGMPTTLLGQPTDSTSAVVGLLRRLRRELPPEVPVHEIDERFTSRIAKQAMLAGGLGRKARQDKATVDKVSAALILQSFLESPLR